MLTRMEPFCPPTCTLLIPVNHNHREIMIITPKNTFALLYCKSLIFYKEDSIVSHTPPEGGVRTKKCYITFDTIFSALTQIEK